MFGRSTCLFVLCFTCLLAGCGGKTKPDRNEVELPDWLTRQDQPGGGSAQVPPQRQVAVLGLRLNPGDQFPLRKIVQQELTQNSLTGTPRVSQSRLELMFAITVQEKRDDRIRLSVRYDRVKYDHNVADEHIEFDSARGPVEVPSAVRAYRDMVGDGFSFWIGQDNQIVEAEGFTDFLNRCLRNVPTQEQQQVALGMEAGSGETGIANFIDNTIGLLPFGKRTTPGDTWERQQSFSRPVPMHAHNVYTLKELNDQEAVIDIRGSIIPSTTVNGLDNGRGVQVTVNGGSTLGSCTIFRDTGLPRQSRVERIVEMTAVMANAVQFHQTKRVLTTIESYPPSRSNPTMIGWTQPEMPPRREPSSAVTPASFEQTVIR